MSQFLAIITGQPESTQNVSESDLGAALSDAPGTIVTGTSPGSVMAMKMAAPDAWRARDRQPSVDVAAQLAVVADCRLDNRLVLQSALGLESSAIDSEILLRGYERWGDGLPSYLNGDFAGVVWDCQNRKLLVFRDPLGVKPLFFRLTTAGLVVASDVELIGKVVGFGAAVDAHRIVEHLLWRYRSVDSNILGRGRAVFLADISWLVWPDSAVRRRYWFPESRTAFSTEPEAMESLASLFKQSVERRLDALGPIFVHLSGGLDSSSIVCAASEITRRAGEAPSITRALSERFLGMSTDEGPFIRAVLDWTNIDAAEWNDELAVLSDVERPSLAGPGMDAYRTSGSTGDVDIVAASGGHVLLSGQGGDQFGSAAEVVDDMIEREPIDFLSEALFPSYLSLAQRTLRIRLMVRSILPDAIRSAVRVRRFRNQLPKWLNRQWHDLAANLVRTPADNSEIAFSDKIRCARWSDLTLRALLESRSTLDQRAAARRGVEFRYPFLDRDLVVAMLSVPTEFWPRPDTNARIHRRALSSLLPPLIANRRTKVHFTEPFARRLLRNQELLRRMFHEGEWISAPYVDRSVAQSLLQRLDKTRLTEEWMTWRSVWGIATLEAWLRRISDYTFPREEPIDDRRARNSICRGSG